MVVYTFGRGCTSSPMPESYINRYGGELRTTLRRIEALNYGEHDSQVS